MPSDLARQAAQPAWRKASFCASSECLEVGSSDDGMILVRDSAEPRGHMLRWTPAQWQSLVGSIKAGRLDDLA
ncbi:MAG TPA: DUF397 domain-containing protein [Streptosporangiaceae bacterium]|nr:DUF397 domain-containing protein [Streptosporangiaceae bacterium]